FRLFAFPAFSSSFVVALNVLVAFPFDLCFALFRVCFVFFFCMVCLCFFFLLFVLAWERMVVAFIFLAGGVAAFAHTVQYS
ncbi:hypothetical protein, partial [Acinetobacter baumannii]